MSKYKKQFKHNKSKIRQLRLQAVVEDNIKIAARLVKTPVSSTMIVMLHDCSPCDVLTDNIVSLCSQLLRPKAWTEITTIMCT